MSLKTLLLRTIIKHNKCINYAPIAIASRCYERCKDDARRSYGKALATAVVSSVLIGSALNDQTDTKKKHKEDVKPNKEKIIEAGEKRADLPTYRAEEVSKHDTKTSFWVTYRHGVYDITKFLPSHPGGEQILNAAGLSVEPFWNVYGMHKTEEIYQLLESYRIGNLHDDDIADHTDEELWAREPVRDKRLIVKTARPFNAEIPPKLQVEHLDTPNELFYVRQHMPVPELDPREHKLRVVVVGETGVATELSLQQLKQFPAATLRAALMCAGNRRSEMNQVKPVKGISWAGGAIGNAVWRGVWLRDVLLHCGVDPTDTRGKHVILSGADTDATGERFNTSVPLAVAMDGHVLLATHMNGQPLPPDHGRPLRAVVPGAAAVRSVKWLESITVSSEESSSHWHQKDYRSFNPSKTWETADFSTAPPVYSLPVTSAICDPQDGDTVKIKNGCIEVRGYAYSGGGAKIVRVDVSGDRGGSWVEAQRLVSDEAPPHDHYSWTLWTAYVPVTGTGSAARGEVELWVKATDSNFNTQPEKFDHIWNIRGILSNAYHKIRVRLEK